MGNTQFIVDKEQLQVRIERVLNATPEKIYSVVSDGSTIPEWWGPSRLKTVVEAFDFQVGGKWRFVQSDDEGNTYAFYGEYLEIVPNQLVRNTFEFEPFAGHVIEEKMTLTPLEDDKTKMQTVSQYASIEDLNGMVESGMESGAVETYERLAALVEG